jgi:DNA-3-methyladenine glycosylase
MRKKLPKTFFERRTTTVAKELLGKYIVKNYSAKHPKSRPNKREIGLMITEVEAYDGPFDLASHARFGSTPRTKIMFGEAGYFYVYFTYGMHWMVNVVTGPKNYPAAILLRAGTYIDPVTKKEILINGPARLTKFLGINKKFNEKPANRKTGLWFEDRGMAAKKKNIIAGKRIGVDYGGPIWSAKKYNFKLKPA